MIFNPFADDIKNHTPLERSKSLWRHQEVQKRFPAGSLDLLDRRLQQPHRSASPDPPSLGRTLPYFFLLRPDPPDQLHADGDRPAHAGHDRGQVRLHIRAEQPSRNPDWILVSSYIVIFSVFLYQYLLISIMYGLDSDWEIKWRH